MAELFFYRTMFDQPNLCVWSQSRFFKSFQEVKSLTFFTTSIWTNLIKPSGLLVRWFELSLERTSRKPPEMDQWNSISSSSSSSTWFPSYGSVSFLSCFMTILTLRIEILDWHQFLLTARLSKASKKQRFNSLPPTNTTLGRNYLTLHLNSAHQLTPTGFSTNISCRRLAFEGKVRWILTVDPIRHHRPSNALLTTLFKALFLQIISRCGRCLKTLCVLELIRKFSNSKNC